jgi:hypothetical protein
MFPNTTQINIYQAKYSTEDLDKLHETIDGQMKNLVDKGLPITSVGNDLKNQKIVIGLQYTNENIQNELKTLFNPDMLSFKVEKNKNLKYSRWEDVYRAVSGGPQVDFAGTGWCTNGFSATDSSGSYYLISAGHCMSYAGEPVTQGVLNGRNQLVAYANRNTFTWGSSADASASKVDPSNATSWISSSYSAQATLLSSRQLNDYVGLVVCFSLGETDTNVCSTVSDTNYSYFAGGKYFTNHRKTNLTIAQPGDSGSPVYTSCGSCGNYGAIYGIVTAGDSGSDTEVAYITNIESQLGVSALLNNTTPVTITLH